VKAASLQASGDGLQGKRQRIKDKRKRVKNKEQRTKNKEQRIQLAVCCMLPAVYRQPSLNFFLLYVTKTD